MDATEEGKVSNEILQREITIAFGKNRHDKNWVNVKGTVGNLLVRLASFERGDKDGNCLLQGELVGAQRVAKNVSKNHVLMIDIDNGMSVDEVGKIIVEKGLFAAVWTTHSFGKDTTEVAEEHFHRWCKTNNAPIEAGQKLTDQLKRYLKEVKRYRQSVFTVFENLGKKLVEGGMKYIIKHAPMPKLRVLFLLGEPFDFTTGETQKARIEEWKNAYTNASNWLGVAVDSTCVDPSRLMYTPRVPKGAQIEQGQHEIIFFEGSPLELESLPKVAFGKGLTGNVFSNFGIDDDDTKNTRAFKTPGLTRFAKEFPDFDIIKFLADTAPDDRRSSGDQKCAWACPNDESHSSMKADDTAFFVAFNDDRWHAQCMHDGCKHASNDDRLWYLDMLCQKYGITSASELEAWSASGQQAQIDASEATHTANDPEALDEAAGALSETSTPAEIDKVLGAVALIDNRLKMANVLNKIVEKTRYKLSDLKARVRDLHIAAKHALRSNSPDAFDPTRGHAVPEDLETATTIWTDWDWDVVVKAAKSRLRKLNRDDPKIFAHPDGEAFRIVNDSKGVARIESMSGDRWMAELDGALRFKETDMLTGRNAGVPTPPNLKSVISGASDMGWPECGGISRIAMFDKDGNLQTSRGFNESLGIYLDPNYEPITPPETVTETDLETALDWICEPLLDFPFSDAFAGGDTLPIYTDQKDKDGHPVPNFDRGMSSRANMIAAMLQPFVRAMIDGPTPGYHIDKPAAGTGAGYLVNVISCIISGQTATTQTVSDNNEEFRKEITSTLREGAQMIFLDNINRKMDSGELASALTTGRWKARKLGVSENVEVDVKAMWLFAGNNMAFSHELMRRMVPIRLDAQVQNPAKDRPKTFFKHAFISDWCIQNRPQLIWACQTIIKWWLQKGAPGGAKTLNSFDHYARVMGGIIEAAGIPGFLDNVNDYLEINDEDDDTEKTLAGYFHEEFGETVFSNSDAIAAIMRRHLSQIPDFYPVKYDQHDDSGNTKRLGMWLSKTMVGRTYELHKTSGAIKVTLKKVRTTTARGYQITVVKG